MPGSGSASSPAPVLGLLLAAAACSPAPLSYTSPPGTVDGRPVSPFGDSDPLAPPDLAGSAFDPDKGLGVQGFADSRIGARVADFAAHHIIYSAFQGPLHFFYPVAGRGPGPGLCRSRVYSLNWGGEGGSAGTKGSWQPDAYAVAGSVAPLPEPPPAGYEARLEAACRARRDMGLWYRAPPGKAYVAARLADAIVAAARHDGPLPFRLSCRPYPPGIPERPRCAGVVRKTVASINPRAIFSAGECLEESRPSCLAIEMAKFPERGRAGEEELWTLEVDYRDEGELRIASVTVSDTQLIIE